ncbi:MAG: PEP-CTERM sorting domain-containing protein [Candidatus Hydrogenedentes bacterium]|nr:PEP-CTERM sorting domain-containing protein [Candidatus Hydrogenedentota bacterium]
MKSSRVVSLSLALVAVLVFAGPASALILPTEDLVPIPNSVLTSFSLPPLYPAVAGLLFYDPSGDVIGTFGLTNLSLLDPLLEDAPSGTLGNVAGYWSFNITYDPAFATISGNPDALVDWTWVWSDMQLLLSEQTGSAVLTTTETYNNVANQWVLVDGSTLPGNLWVYASLDFTSGRGVFAFIADGLSGLLPTAALDLLSSESGGGSYLQAEIVPEPASLTLLGLGLGGLLITRFRKRS